MNYNDKKNIKVFRDQVSLAEYAANELVRAVSNSKQNDFHIAISGGSTPYILFKILVGKFYSQKINWEKVKIFWCDERMVPSDDNESNYGNAKRILLDHIPIPSNNIFPIQGENDPKKEVKNYGEKILENVPTDKSGFPVFDTVFLGLGEDGHTASLFPGQNLKEKYKDICGIALHPVSKQKRISLTMSVINNSQKIYVIAAGQKKSPIVYKILQEKSMDFPASSVANGDFEWLLDKDAGSLLKESKNL